MSNADIFEYIIANRMNDSTRGLFMAFHERVKFKMNAAKCFLKNLEQLEQAAGSLAQAKRDDVDLNLDAFLYEIIGVFDAQLQEINTAFQLPLSEKKVKTQSVINKLPNNSQVRKKLTSLKENINGWFRQLREYRNHSAHRRIINFDFVPVSKSIKVYLHKDPLNSGKGSTDETVIQYCKNSIKRMEQLINEIYQLCITELTNGKPKEQERNT